MKRRRIKQDYHGKRSPTSYLAFCQRVKYGMKDNPNCPESLKQVVQQYCEKVDELDRTYHIALDGGRSMIRVRESISAETMLLLDQIAAGMEAACILNPDALLTTGFTITQEGRSANRVKLPLGSPNDFAVSNIGDPGKALGTASNAPGALIHEIHYNVRDPSVEEHWFHKGNYTDPQAMPMDRLSPGNTFFRMRYFGQDGPGPWSAVVSTTIT